MPFQWMSPALRARRAPADRRARSKTHRRRFALEQFEDRTLLSTFSWVGATGDWSNASNWQKDVNNNNHTVPGAGDTAIINDSAADVTVDAAISITTLTLSDGKVTLNADMAISSNLTVAAGATFNGEGGTVSFVGVDSAVTLNGTATFGDITLNKGDAWRNLTLAGTMEVTGDLTITSISQINGGQINVGGDVHANDTSVSGSTVIVLDHDATIDGGGALPWVRVSDNAAVTAAGSLQVQSLLLVDSGSFTVDNDLVVTQNLTVAAGATLDVPGTLGLNGPNSAAVNIAPGSTINVKDLSFAKYNGLNTFNLTGELSITGDLSIVAPPTNAQYSIPMNGGQINVGGNVTTNRSTLTGGTTVIHLGAGTHTITSTDNGALPSLLVSGGSTTINGDLQVMKLDVTGGTLKAPTGTLGISWNFIQTGGTFNANGGTVSFNGASSAVVSIGATQLNHVTVGKIPTKDLIIQNAPLKVGGNFTINEVKDITGAITVKGNLTSTDETVGGNGVITMTGDGYSKTITAAPGDFPNDGIIVNMGSASLYTNVTTPLDGPLTIQSAWAINKATGSDGLLTVGNNVTTMTGVGGDATIVFAGGANQTLTATAPGAGVVGVKIDKSGGSLTLNTAASGNTLRVNGSWIVAAANAGAINLNGSAIKFTAFSLPTATMVDANPSAMTFNDVEVAIGSNSLNAVQMVVDGTLTLTNVYYVAGVITARGNVTTAAYAVNSAGGRIEFVGTGPQTLSASSPNGGVPAVVINKPSGTLTLAGPNTINANGNWTWTKGTVVSTGSTIRLTNANTVNTGPGNGGMKFNNFEIAIGSNTLGVTNKLGVLGYLTIDSAWGINAASGAITVAGNLTSNDTSVIGTADITMVNSNTATLKGGDFPNGGIIINKGSSATVNAEVTQPLDSLLTLQNIGALTGTLQVGKGVTTHMSMYGMSGNADGSPVIVFEGPGAQTLTAAAANAWIPGLKFNSTGAGSVTLADNGNVTGANALRVSGGWIVAGNGNVNLPTGSNVKLTNGVNRTIDTGASAGFQNVELDTGSSNTVTIAKMVVNGALKVSNLGIANGADIEAKGDVITSNNGYGSASGTSNILINGSGSQILKATAANSRILGIKIAKTGGALTITDDNIINVTGNWTYTGDGSDVNASDSTIRFIGGDKRIQSGAMKFGSVTVAIGSSSKMSIVDANDQAVDALYTGMYQKTSGTIIKGQFKLFP